MGVYESCADSTPVRLIEIENGTIEVYERIR